MLEIAPEGFWIPIVLVLIPLYFANSSAMIFGGGKIQLDFGRHWRDGKPVFGKGKTWKGAFSGILIGTLVGFILSLGVPALTVRVTSSYVVLAFLLSLGAIAGDLAASFFKRRNNLPTGAPVLFLDQLDFVIGGLIFGTPLFMPSFYQAIAIALITLLVHRAANFLAFKLHLKKVPW